MRKSAEEFLRSVRPGEPVFILRAQDKIAPDVIDAWLDMAAHHDAPSEKLDDAERILAEFREWQEANPGKVKVPD